MPTRLMKTVILQRAVWFSEVVVSNTHAQILCMESPFWNPRSTYVCIILLFGLQTKDTSVQWIPLFEIALFPEVVFEQERALHVLQGTVGGCAYMNRKSHCTGLCLARNCGYVGQERPLYFKGLWEVVLEQERPLYFGDWNVVCMQCINAITQLQHRFVHLNMWKFGPSMLQLWSSHGNLHLHMQQMES